jgi:hypothetical protein
MQMETKSKQKKKKQRARWDDFQCYTTVSHSLYLKRAQRKTKGLKYENKQETRSDNDRCDATYGTTVSQNNAKGSEGKKYLKT